MPVWLPYLTASGTPIGSATGDIVTYILGYGVLGVVAVAFAFRIIVPRTAVDDAKEQARTDLLRENERLVAELAKTQGQRDEAMAMAQEKLVPLLVSFNATVSVLLPLLQEMIQRQEQERRGPERRNR